MKQPLEVVFRDMVPLPSLEPEIRRRAAKLEQWGDELISCRVVVHATGDRHHQGHEYRATIDVHVPDDELAVSHHHRGDDGQVVVRAAFDAMDRLLEERSRRRRGDVKQHATARARPAGDAATRDDAGGGDIGD
jgi:ribosome-associated translation inhibitor RaiA